MTEFTSFTKDHVGEKVTDIVTGQHGHIESLGGDNIYPIVAIFPNKVLQPHRTYTRTGLYCETDKTRRLYFGHNIAVKVEGEEIPEEKLICPICQVEHEIKYWSSDKRSFNTVPVCVFFGVSFKTDYDARIAMRKLIKAMEK